MGDSNSNHLTNLVSSHLSSSSHLLLVTIWNKCSTEITIFLMDRWFECTRDKITLLDLNTTSLKENVHGIDRQIRVPMESAPTTKIILSFTKITGGMIINMINQKVMWLINLPSKRGIPEMMIPHNTTRWIIPDYKNHFRITFKIICEKHKYPNHRI